MHILIVGFGYTGESLAQMLLTAGHQVVGLRRTAPPGRLLPTVTESAAHLVYADLHSDEVSVLLPDDITHVVYAISPGERSDDAYRLAYPEGVARTMRLLPQARFLFVSSTSVYAQDTGEEVDESSPALSDTFAARRLRQAEDLVLSKDDSHLVIRSSGIYGPKRMRLLSRLRHFALDEVARSIWTSRVHRDDLARGILFLLERSDTKGVYLASDRAPAQLGEVQDWLKSRSESAFLPPVLRARPGQRKSRRMVARRLLDLGFTYNYPSFREGYSELLKNLPQIVG